MLNLKGFRKKGRMCYINFTTAALCQRGRKVDDTFESLSRTTIDTKRNIPFFLNARVKKQKYINIYVFSSDKPA